MIYCWSVTERYNCGRKFVKTMHLDSLRHLDLYLPCIKGAVKWVLFLEFLDFLNAITDGPWSLSGVNDAPMGTAAGIAYFAEGIDYCNDFKFAVKADDLLPIFQEL